MRGAGGKAPPGNPAKKYQAAVGPCRWTSQCLQGRCEVVWIVGKRIDIITLQHHSASVVFGFRAQRWIVGSNCYLLFLDRHFQSYVELLTLASDNFNVSVLVNTEAGVGSAHRVFAGSKSVDRVRASIVSNHGLFHTFAVNGGYPRASNVTAQPVQYP